MIRNSVYNSKFPKNKVEVIQVSSNGSAEGQILIDVDGVDEILDSRIEIYKCDKPTCLNDKWSTTGVNLYVSGE